LFGLIKEKYENHKFIGEESTNEKVEFNDDPVWIVDPVDGTTNFYHKYV
jgi:fructose-1,6-bisphosphatase/inositol monophosphatase family enzyme